MQKATEIETTRAMKDLGIERAMLHGWPNTYVFTKAIGEMLLENFEKAKVVIIRPTIVTSTYKEPFPGWIEGLRTMDSIFVAYGKGKLKFFAGDPNSTLDMIPGDMVVNCMLAAMAIHSNHHHHNLFIYHIGSSRRNPVKYAEVKSLMQRYLTQNPLLDSRGRPIKVTQLTVLSSMASFHNYIAIHYLPFLHILKWTNMMCCNLFESIYANARRRLSASMRLTELYKPYVFFQGVFDDVNTENLRRMIKGSNTEVMLNFDPKSIEWDEYFVNTHFKGLTKYVLK
ncbi:UNVERIFIED_CONTAM: putative fatty acyl-CoA reductase 4 [Sesamum calycinum]|uniref:Fatty acyl-CoA reductase n=1 Tax=Sesamum calycinum TaxID=2727403 RepID=A0AAW2SDN8_9LAMI